MQIETSLPVADGSSVISKKLLKEVLDRVISFISILDTDGRLLEVNEAVVRALGLPMEKIIGQYAWESPALAFSVETQERVRKALQTAAQGEPVRYIEKYQGAEGEFRHVDMNFMPQMTDGIVTHIVGSGIDVTDLVRQSQELRQTEAEFRMLAESIPQKVWVANADGKVIFVNGRMLKYAGRSESDEEFDWQSLLHPEDRERTQGAWVRAVQETGVYDIEFRLRRHDGEYRWHLSRGNLLKDSDGKPRKWFGTSTDIHDQKLTEEALKKMSENLESLVEARTSQLLEMNRELEAFSYSVSHDLRTPLRSIEGFSQAVLEDEKGRLGERALKDLKRVVDSAQYMGRLIDDLLKLSRLSRKEMSQQTVSLSALAETIFSKKRQLEPSRSIELTVQSTPEVVGDPGLLDLALENLINNAWKFTSQNPHPKIEFGCVEKDGELAFYVRDNGVGFDMAYYNKLFGAFQRLHRSTEFSGTGVGLATVRRIISRHGGKVWADAKVGEGATFYFLIQTVRSSERGRND